MKKSYFLFGFLIASLFAFDTDSKTKDKWVTIFNGNNLDGWTMKIAGHKLGENFGNTFRVENGILSVRYDSDVYKKFNGQFGALYYKKKLTNYRLKAEYRFVGDTASGAPSWGFRDGGIQYQGQAPESIGLNQSFPICLEFNFLGGNGKDERPNGEICALGTIVHFDGKPNSVVCTPPTVKRTIHGDEWVTVEIDVRDGKVSHFVNGTEVLKFDDPRYDPKNEVARTLIVNGDDKVKSGYISLQSNSNPIDFRKIELLEY